jgi:hypothetical protein
MQVKISNAAIMLLAIGLPVSATSAQDLSEEVVELRQLIVEMRDDYERRIGDLEARLDKAERDARGARRDAGEAVELAEETAINQSAGSSAPNTFNPAIGAVLNAHYADVGTGWEEIPGFQPAGEIGTGGSGFSLGEAEFNLKANIDARFFGNITFALAEEDGEAVVEFEEAWMQTTALPAGFTITPQRLSFPCRRFRRQATALPGILRWPPCRRRRAGALAGAHVIAVRSGHRTELGRRVPGNGE